MSQGQAELSNNVVFYNSNKRLLSEIGYVYGNL